MKHPSLFIVSAAVLLAACSQDTAVRQDLKQNPLFAKYYYQDLVDTMANYSIQNDPVVKNADTKKVIENTRTRGQEHIKDATAKINAGKHGGFMSDHDYATGTALLLDGMLYFSQDFNTLPSPETHVILSTMLDPRTGSGTTAFEDKDALDLGLLQTPYGAQSYEVHADANKKTFRSVVLWDRRLERLMGFAQLQ